MRTLKFLLEKEYKQIFRDTIILRMILAMPLIQLLVMPLAADFEIKNVNIAIVDHDRSPYSQELVSKIRSSGYFVLTDFGSSYRNSFEQLESDEADLILEIPQDFERNLVRENQQSLLIAVNAINGTKATVGGSYLGSIIQDFNGDIKADWITPQGLNQTPLIDINNLNWFNPFLNYQFFMVPGILVLLVTMIGAYMCALNIVKEKEVGTIEQINVTPIKKHHFILGKLIPFWTIGIFVFSLGFFLIARLVYDLVPAGSILTLYAFLSLFLVAILGVGLLVSTYSTSQQQAMSLSFFFMMIFILMSGLFTPIESMPEWAKVFAYANPVTYFIEVMRMIVMKGSGFKDIQNHFLIMTGFALLFNTWAIINYKKTS
ncbi:MAG: ABC transporter permease [Thermonemataceae bacterium]